MALGWAWPCLGLPLLTLFILFLSSVRISHLYIVIVTCSLTTVASRDKFLLSSVKTLTFLRRNIQLHVSFKFLIFDSVAKQVNKLVHYYYFTCRTLESCCSPQSKKKCWAKRGNDVIFLKVFFSKVNFVFFSQKLIISELGFFCWNG